MPTYTVTVIHCPKQATLETKRKATKNYRGSTGRPGCGTGSLPMGCPEGSGVLTHLGQNQRTQSYAHLSFLLGACGGDRFVEHRSKDTSQIPEFIKRCLSDSDQAQCLENRIR